MKTIEGRRSSGNEGYRGRKRRIRTVLPVATLGLLMTAAHTQAQTSTAASSATSSAASDTSLPAVSVHSQREQATATSPVSGYVATRSATATKSDTPLNETPQSISVITARQMDDQGVQSIGQALRYTAGVIGEQYGGLNDTVNYFTVRGFPNSFPFIDGLSTETYFTLLSPSTDPYSLERIDVLRGPASVLYGQNIPGGLINLVTKRPTDEPLHEVSLDAGNYGAVGGRFDFSGPVTKDNSLLYRFTGSISTTGSQQDYQTDKKAFVAPAFTWRPSADTTFTLLSHFSYRNSGYPSADLPAIGTLYPGPNGARISTSRFDGEPNINQIRRTEEAIGYELEHRFSDMFTVRQNLRFTHVNLDESVGGDAGLQDDLSTIDRFAYLARASANTFTVDNQAQFKFATGALQHTLVFGLDYVHSVDQWAENDSTSMSSLNLYRPVYGGDVTFGGVDYSVEHHLDQVGLYAQDQIKLGKWVGTFSVRQDWANTKEYDRLAGTTDQNNSEHRFTYRAGLVYLFDSGFAPYVSYSTSFQPGLGSTYDGSALKPTTGQSIEAGVKFQPKGQNSFVTLSVYNTLQKNVTESDFVHTEGNYVVQTGAQRVKGIELSGVADLGAGLNLTAAYTYMNGTIAESDQGYAGNQAVNVPHNTFSLWLDKTFQGGWIRGFGLGGGMRYIGPQYGDEANTLRMPGFTLFDAGVHYDTKHWRFAVNAQNLFDRVYVNCQASTYCAYGLRRSVVGRATYHW